MDHQQIAHLLELYFIGHITPAQKDQLAAWIEEHGHTPEFEQLMASSWQQFQPAQQVDAAKAGAWLQHIHLRSAELERTVKDGRLTLTEQPAAHRNSTMAAGQGSTDRPGNTPVIDMRARRRNWYMAAAAVVLIAGTVIVARMVSHKNDTPAPQAIAGKQDIAPPAVSKAVLTLANGQQIVLDSAAQGALASQGSVRVVKLEDGRIAYEGQANGALQYNTLTVPAGSNITSITLADGTTVLLNAASSITYPVAFTGNERKVTITGEVWFEVAKDPTKKFLVSAANATLEVLGTKFNVNAYSDEGQVKVTLAEGSLRVKTGMEGSNMQNGPVLKPGQQAIVNAGHLVLNNEPDMEQVLAWKNGMFLYKGTDIRTIMRELARVYKVEVSYESVSKEMFYAETPRNTNISSLFNMLELTGEVHFKIEGNKVTVLK